MGVFAKFVFAVAHVFAQGGADLPPLLPASPKTGEVVGRTEVYETAYREPCAPGADVCPGITFVIRQRFVMCTTPGVWTMTVRIGLIAQEPAGGKVWMTAPDGSRTLVAAFNAGPGMPAYVGGSLQAQSLTYDACYGLWVEANRSVEVIAEPGVSFVTVGR